MSKVLCNIWRMQIWQITGQDQDSLSKSESETLQAVSELAEACASRHLTKGIHIKVDVSQYVHWCNGAQASKQQADVHS